MFLLLLITLFCLAKFCIAVKFCRDELRLLQEPASHVGEVVKVMSKSKVLVKVHLLSLLCFSKVLYLMEHYLFVERNNYVLSATSKSMLLKNYMRTNICGLLFLMLCKYLVVLGDESKLGIE